MVEYTAHLNAWRAASDGEYASYHWRRPRLLRALLCLLRAATLLLGATIFLLRVVESLLRVVDPCFAARGRVRNISCGSSAAVRMTIR